MNTREDNFNNKHPFKQKKDRPLTNKINVWALEKIMLYTSAFLKSDSHVPNSFCVICLIESPLEVMKNAFYFILKALFVFKIFMFLSQHFGHVGETAWLER